MGSVLGVRLAAPGPFDSRKQEADTLASTTSGSRQALSEAGRLMGALNLSAVLPTMDRSRGEGVSPLSHGRRAAA
jgi:hypothetical protein